MPSTRSRPSSLRTALRCAVAGAALAAAFAGASAVTAQDGSGLRGAFPAASPVPTGPLDRPPRREPLEANALEPDRPAYQPASPGAVPETADIDRLLGNLPSDEFGQDEPVERPNAATRRNMAVVERRQAGATGDVATTGSVRRPASGNLLPPPDDTPIAPNAAVRPLGAGDEGRAGAVASAAQRTGSVEAGGRTADDSPYEATGLRLGGFVLRPALEQGVEWSSNATGTTGGAADFMSSTTLRLGAQSEWNNHSLNVDATGTWRRSLRGSGLSELTAGASGALRLDLGRGYAATLAAGYAAAPEEAALDQPTVGRPLRHTLNASAGLARTLGPATLAATAAAQRNVYGAATLESGGTASQATSNNTLYSLTLRGGYEISPAIQPFVEAEYGRRIFDAHNDTAGVSRSANRYGARAGLAFDRGEKLTGEVSAGWLTERPDDPARQAISGVTADASVAWSPLRGTQVDLGASSGIEATSLAGSSGAFVHGASVSLTHQFGARITGIAQLNGELRRYAGTAESDISFGGSVALTWWLNRYAGVTGRIGYEQLDSTIANRGYGATSAFLGLTLQK